MKRAHPGWQRILCGGLVSLSVHGVLLAGWQPAASSAREVRSAQPISVRLLASSSEAAERTASLAVATALPAEPATPAAAADKAPRREAVAARSNDPPVPVHESSPGAFKRAEVPAVGAEATESLPARLARSPGRADELPPAPAYRSGNMDPGPRPLDEIDPVFPAKAGLQQGNVVLRLLISEAGELDSIAVVRSSPPALFDQAAVDAFARARFSPGMVFGVAVKSQITIEVEFTPFNRGAGVSSKTY